MADINSKSIRIFLEKLGSRYPYKERLYLLGGSGLCLLGSLRPTLDIDYVGDDLKKNTFQEAMEAVAREMHLDVEAVPIYHFLPLPEGALERSIFISNYGEIEVFIFDPYSIALSKLERGFDTDMEDLVFLIKQKFVEIDRLEKMKEKIFDQATKFEIDQRALENHWQDLVALLHEMG